ncbi:MAG: septal ring lytic transglycosylase RlpA family protein [Candidatus Gracilibacteria bacterium]|nr:septal ring lytic transglycosylase RlpA family protein [Candidatus Peregrinibacteria bacterium]
MAVISIGFSSHFVTAQEVAPFPDVEEGNEYFVAVSYLKEMGLIEGYEDGTFKPYQSINRAEALKVLLGAFPEEETTTMEPASPDPELFPDVLSSDWFYAYVMEAKENGLVEGYPDGLFHPEQTINKAESLKIALIREGGFIPEEATAMPYTDVPTTEWYAPYAEVSKNRTIFLESRSDGALHADDLMTRGEFVKMIYRIIKTAEGSTFARATWYGSAGVNWGTASGEKFDYAAMTAAHKDLPFGTIIRVTNVANGKQIDVKINDRGPYPTGLDLDLTAGAFEEIASLGAGVIMTEYEIVEDPTSAEEQPVEEPSQLPPEYGF